METPIVFYDLEATSVWASYAEITTIGVQYGLNAEPEIIKTEEQDRKFRDALVSPRWTKVGFNNINYDDILLIRHGYEVNVKNLHDIYLMAKTVSPTLPAYGLKFLSWFFFRDIHHYQGMLNYDAKKRYQDLFDDPGRSPVLHEEYCKHDVRQTARLFRLFWPNVQMDLHWDAYNLELDFGPVLHEMMLVGGDYVDTMSIDREIVKLEEENIGLNQIAQLITNDEVQNARSTAQVARWLAEAEDVTLSISDKGNLLVRQADLLALLDLDNQENDKSRLARIAYDIRANQKQLGYLKAYSRAAFYESERHDNGGVQTAKTGCFIPKSFSSSRARTRRILSNSRFGINFQNSNKSAKRIQLVPNGYIGCFIDLTQIENVVHIWASDDQERRRAYEADTDYNEYVWLCNRILGGSPRSRKELDSIRSPVNPSWSVYKMYKTIKLAMNFFMGPEKFCRLNGIPETQGRRLFDEVHMVCPTIRKLLKKVERELARNGFIQDPFGHIYSGNPMQAYKVLAYFIQGCGTGSIPKAMARAVYNTLHPENENSLGHMSGIIHDELGFRIRSELPDSTIVGTLRSCLYDCEQRFSHLFDNIPLRAKLSLTVTNTAEAEELNHYHLTPLEFENKILEYANKARKA